MKSSPTSRRSYLRREVAPVACFALELQRQARIARKSRRRLVARMVSIYNDPAHWRARAGKTREIAAQLRDAKDKQVLATIADSYDRLAQDADRRSAEQVAPL